MVRTAKHHRRQVGPRAAPPSRGTSQAGMGRYNARLVLSLIRSHGSLSKAAIARLTGLSAQHPKAAAAAKTALRKGLQVKRSLSDRSH